jgi:hypothetical protein
MALFRFFFAPVLLAVAVIAGRAEKARAPAPAAEIRAVPSAEGAGQAAPEPSAPPRGRAARHRAPAR